MSGSLNNITEAVSTLRARLFRVRWRWVLLAGAGVSVVTTVLILVLISLVISIYIGILAAQPGGVPDADRMMQFSRAVSEQMGEWGPLVLSALLTAFAGAWVARKSGTAPILHGVLIGLVSAITGWFTGLLFELIFGPSGTVSDIAGFAWFLLTIGAGTLGGLEGRAALTGQEALYRASQAIGAAGNPQAVVDAIGEHLAGSEVSRLALWRVSGDEDDTPTEIALLAAWERPAARAWPPRLRLDVAEAPSLTNLERKTPLLLQTDDLPASERVLWERLGVRSAVLLPLTTSDGAWVGLLMAASERERGFTGITEPYTTIAAQVSPVLENFRLVRQARQTAVLEERQRLAREIHDTLAQGFTSIVMHLEAAEQALPAEMTTPQQHLDQARRTARESLVQARRLVWALRPEHLERASLSEALERIVARWAGESGIVADVTTTGTASPLHPEVEVTLLRVVQEALANTRKHARASQVTVTLSYMSDVIVLDVQDDGVGFDPARIRAPSVTEAAGGFGLTAMRERVEELGGKLLVESAPGEGTTVVAEIPFPNK